MVWFIVSSFREEGGVSSSSIGAGLAAGAAAHGMAGGVAAPKLADAPPPYFRASVARVFICSTVDDWQLLYPLLGPAPHAAELLFYVSCWAASHAVASSVAWS